MAALLWSLKGGSGCSVTSAVLAIHWRGLDPGGVVLVDLCGDQPPILGWADSPAPGLTDWAEAEEPPPDGLARLVQEVSPGLGLLAIGHSGWDSVTDPADRGARAGEELRRYPSRVVIDAGCIAGTGPRQEFVEALARHAHQSVLVTKACYLALRRMSQVPLAPSKLVLLQERGRALRTADVEAAVGVRVAAQVELDPAISRAVDAGLLGSRVPRGLGEILGSIE